jgi:hypothetical protein
MQSFWREMSARLERSNEAPNGGGGTGEVVDDTQ